MKMNFWPVLAMMVASNAIAQDTNMMSPAGQSASAVAAATDTNIAPATGPKKLHRRRHIPPVTDEKETAMVETSVTLSAGPAEVIAKHVNVRGQPSLKGEVIAHLTTGNGVTVIEQINLQKHKADEPSQWAKISFPTNANVWVFTRFIDTTNKTVLPKKLNLRAGPGENYSIVGLITRDTPVNEVSIKGEWTEIEPPTNAYAFVAAMYLKQETNATPIAAAETNVPPMETNNVTETTPIMTEPTNAPAEETNAAPVLLPAETNAPAINTPVIPPAEPEATPPPLPRVVEHVGVVRHVVSPVAPTDYEIFDPASGKNIDYLFTTSTNLDLSRYVGLHIVVTGEEGLDARWKDTPVITIQKIQVAE